jgi:ribosomal protein S18 acetylase RimI-like enzyme
MRIRPLVQADLRLVQAWMQDAPGAPAWSKDDLDGIVQIPSSDQRRVRRGWVAEAENGSTHAGFVVATVLCIPKMQAECEIEFVFVSPEARQQGIGRTLVQTVFTWARDMGAEEVWLELRESNTRALRLYQQCGFAIVGRRPGYYADPREDAVQMRGRIE